MKPLLRVLASPWQGLQHATRRWWQARLRPVDVHHLDQRHLYILPTPTGWAYAALMVLLLVTAINEQLNLGYALCFLLTGAAALSIPVAHRNVHGLSLQLREGPPIHRGQAAALALHIDNPSARTRHALAVRAVPESPSAEAPWLFLEAAPRRATVCALSWQPDQRGHLPLPVYTLESRYPLGLFRVWTVWRPLARQWVYPARLHPTPPWPGASALDDPTDPGARTRVNAGGDEEQIRPYRRGDPLSQLHWKKTAQSWTRGGEAVSRESLARLSPTRWLQWTEAGGGDPETRLSRLASWIADWHDQAPEGGVRFGLILPRQRIAVDSGPAHTQHCLQQLALMGQAPPPETP